MQQWTSSTTEPTPSGDMLEVGRVSKPHGTKGEVVVDLVTNQTQRLHRGSLLHSETGQLKVERSSPHKSGWIVAFEGFSTRSEAELLRGEVLMAPAPSDPSELWVHKLIGSKVRGRGGELLGEVVAVEANPASDLLVLDGGGLIPLNFVVRHGSGQVVVDMPPGLLDI